MREGAPKDPADTLSFGCGCALAAILAAISIGILAYLLTTSP